MSFINFDQMQVGNLVTKLHVVAANILKIKMHAKISGLWRMAMFDQFNWKMNVTMSRYYYYYYNYLLLLLLLIFIIIHFYVL